MTPTSHPNFTNIRPFPRGGRAAVTIQQAEDNMAALGVEKLPLGTGWYHEAALAEAKRDLEPRELPWWAEAEHESRAKNTVRTIY